MNQTTRYEEACSRIDKALETRETSLSLKGLELREIPESIGQLVDLEELYLHHNKLTELPDCIGNLSKLRCLHLDDNKFTNISECIGQLVNLDELYLEENQLNSLPSSLEQLAKLRLLRASQNQLRHFPLCLTKCTNLLMLDLAHNQLEELPESLRDLDNLKVILLHGNRKLGIPREKLGQQRWCTIVSKKVIPKLAPQVLNYYFSTYKLTKRPLNEAKLILVGRGGAGKTSLRRRLISNEFNESEDQTPGIQVEPWLSLLDKEEVKLNVWDFGGQEIMYATHQFFLTKRSLYVFVINAREGEQDANVEYWLNLITAYGDNSPVLIAINKCEQHSLDLDERDLRKRFPCIREFIWTDCKTNKGLHTLRAAIERETLALLDLQMPFPEKWFRIKKKLEEMSEDYITYDAYKKLCSVHQEEDATKQEVLVDFLNDLGSVLYFPNDVRLCFLGVLKPDWLTQCIYCLLNTDKLKESGGVLAVSELSYLLDNTRYPKEQHFYLLALMEKFELCFEIPNAQYKMFLIPELLPKKTPVLPEWNTQEVLGFEYHYNILPEGLLPRFIVRTHTLSDGCARWRKGVELINDKAAALVRADVQEKCIYIAVRGSGRQPRELLAVIRQHFEEIHSAIKGLVVDEKVPVPDYPEVTLYYRNLLTREANGMSTVQFETSKQVVELSLGGLLDNFEEPASRKDRANFFFDGDLVMAKQEKTERYGGDNYKGANFNNCVVAKRMENVHNVIRDLKENRGELSEILDDLRRHSKLLMEHLNRTQLDSKQEKMKKEKIAEEVAKSLDQLVTEAKEEKPSKDDFKYFSGKLTAIAKTTEEIATPLINTVGKLSELLGFK